LGGDGYYKGSIYGWKEVFIGGEFRRKAIEQFCGENLFPFATHYSSTSSSASLRLFISFQPSIINDDYYYHGDFYYDDDYYYNDYLV